MEKKEHIDFLSEMEEVKVYGGNTANADDPNGTNEVAGCESNTYCGDAHCGNCTIQCGCLVPGTHKGFWGCPTT